MRQHAIHRRSASAVLAVGIMLMACAIPALAQNQNAYKVQLVVNGSNLISGSGIAPGPVNLARTLSVGGVTADLSAAADKHVGAKASLSGTGAAQARVQADASYNFFLQPPPGANVKGGKLVLHVVLEGTAVGDADVHLVAAVHADFGKGTQSALISDATTKRVEFDLVADIAPFIEDLTKAEGTVHLHLDASAKLGGASNQVSSAEATNATRVTGFRVLNGAGVQVTGFGLNVSGGTTIPEVNQPIISPPVVGLATAVEFYNADVQALLRVVGAGRDRQARQRHVRRLDPYRTDVQRGHCRGPGTGRRVPLLHRGVSRRRARTSMRRADWAARARSPTTSGSSRATSSTWTFPGATGECPAGSVPVYRLLQQWPGRRAEPPLHHERRDADADARRGLRGRRGRGRRGVLRAAVDAGGHVGRGLEKRGSGAHVSRLFRPEQSRDGDRYPR